MKKLKLLTALTMGIMASSSGVIQVKAAVNNFYVDFATKEVANYDNYKQTFSADTYNLDTQGIFFWIGSYYFDSCPTAFTTNTQYILQYRLNASGSYTNLGNQPLPDFICTTIPTLYTASISINIPNNAVLALMSDDADFVQFRTRIVIDPMAALNNRVLYLQSYTTYFDITYDFNTTYLFNYFLSDQAFDSSGVAGATGVFNSTQVNRLLYVYTNAGNDSYYIRNTNTSTIGTTRKKYAVDYNEEFFRGNSIGAGFERISSGAADAFTFPASVTASFVYSYVYNYYFLNAANLAQAIVDPPILEFVEEDCGSFLALNVGCFINNAFAYITNDAPIVSDAFTLLNAGIGMAAQTFGIIGEFADDNVFGVLVLAGFGFIAVKWFLKND